MEPVDLSFKGLRDSAFEARDVAARQLSVSPTATARVEMEFVQAIAAVQIAQELNEIKQLLQSKTDHGDQDFVSWLRSKRDELWPSTEMPGWSAVNELITQYESKR